MVQNNPMLHYWSVPVILVVIIGFWIAHCILSVYEMIIDALFLCFCVDYNNNDGSPGKEYYSPPSLMQFLTGEEVDAALKPLRSPDSRDFWMYFILHSITRYLLDFYVKEIHKKNDSLNS